MFTVTMLFFLLKRKAKIIILLPLLQAISKVCRLEYFLSPVSVQSILQVVFLE